MANVNLEETLPFIVAVQDEEPDQTLGIFRSRDPELALRSVPVTLLRENLVRAVQGLRSVFDEAASVSGTLKLKEAQVQFEVSASGGVNFVGTAEVKGTGAITLIFRE